MQTCLIVQVYTALQLTPSESYPPRLNCIYCRPTFGCKLSLHNTRCYWLTHSALRKLQSGQRSCCKRVSSIFFLSVHWRANPRCLFLKSQIAVCFTAIVLCLGGPKHFNKAFDASSSLRLLPNQCRNLSVVAKTKSVKGFFFFLLGLLITLVLLVSGGLFQRDVLTWSGMTIHVL